MLNIKPWIKLFVLVGLALLITGCQSVNMPKVEDMLTNFDKSLPGLWRLVTAGSYIMGIAFILRGVYALKVYGDLRTMMSTQTNLKSTLMLFLVGSALMFTDTIFRNVMMTTFGTTEVSPIGYQSSPLGFSGQSMHVILRFVQLIGLISFIRGWIALTQAQQPGGHSSMGKAFTHILGGTLAINIEGTRNVLMGTFGIS